MAYKNTQSLENFVADDSATKFCHCKPCHYLLIGNKMTIIASPRLSCLIIFTSGKRQIYPQVRSAPCFRPLSSNVEHAPRHHSEEYTNIPETTLYSSIEPPTPTFIPSSLPYITPSSLSQPVVYSSSAILSSQSDPSSSPVGGHPTSTSGVSQSRVPSPSIVCVLCAPIQTRRSLCLIQPTVILTPSNVALASGKLQSNMPTVTPTIGNTHVGIIVGSVVGGLVAILLGVAVWYCL